MANELDAKLAVLEGYGEQWGHDEVDDAQSLTDLVKDKIQDTSYTHDRIVQMFNRCLRKVSGKFTLADLEVYRPILTDPRSNWVNLPADYQRKLSYCHSTTHNRKISRYGSLAQLYRLFSQLDQFGRVIGVTVSQRRLYYQRVPETAETLRIRYYRYPDRLRDRYDKPTCLPEHLTEDLLVSYACREAYEEIEDGLEGQKVNTAYYDKKYKEAEGDLRLFLGPEEDEPEEIAEEIDWESYLYG
jgi:hypothetical protein